MNLIFIMLCFHLRFLLLGIISIFIKQRNMRSNKSKKNHVYLNNNIWVHILTDKYDPIYGLNLPNYESFQKAEK